MSRTLDNAAVRARIPHQGRMCLIDSVLDWDHGQIRCRAVGHDDPDHPLRSAAGLLACCAIEYAAQAMALHAVLVAAAGPKPAHPGLLAAARQVRLHVPRLDTVPGALLVSARHLRGDARQAIYGFGLHDEQGHPLVEGRATVVLDAGGPAPGAMGAE